MEAILSEALDNVTAESGSMIIIEENEDDDVVEKKELSVM